MKTTTKQVRFNTTVRVRTTLHINDYSRRQIKATWYSQRDENSFRQDIKETVLKMRDAGISFISTESQSSRGLEHLISQEAITRKSQNINACRDAVFDAHGSSTRGIARACSTATKTARLAAHDKGIEDAIVARAIHVLEKNGYKLSRETQNESPIMKQKGGPSPSTKYNNNGKNGVRTLPAILAERCEVATAAA